MITSEDAEQYLRWWANPEEECPRLHEHDMARRVLAELDRTRAQLARWKRFNPWKPRVVRDYEGWAVLLDGRWRLCSSWRDAVTAAVERCNEHPVGCGQKGCPCTRPGPVCAELPVAGDGRFCPRCGWAWHLHGVAP